MHTSLRNLLAGLIDYAGLFPPARLPLDQALRNYADYRQGPDGWMLGRFVCPAARLAEMAPFHEELFASAPPFSFAVLGRGGATTAELLDGLREDLEAITAFRACHGERVVADVFEVRLPGEVLASSHRETAAGLFSAVAEIVYEVQRPALSAVFYEPTFGPDWRSSLGMLAEALAEDNTLGQHAGRWTAGFKLRCGGTETSAIPSPEQVAFVLTTCRNAGVPLKATAGLHHPVRRFDPSLQAKSHGFLNVFGAGVLAHARRLSEDQVRQVIEEENPVDFVFDDTGFRWKDLRAPAEEVAEARRHAVVSFGSCSFDEPLADLRALGLLPQ